MTDLDNDRNKGPSTARRVRDHLERQPMLRHYLQMGVINHAALARRLAPLLGISSEEAVEVATRRFEQQLAGDVGSLELSRLLSKSRLEMRTKVVIITATNDWLVMARLEKVMKGMFSRRAFLQVIQGTDSITIITDQDNLEDMVAAVGSETIINTRTDLAEILVKSPPNIAETPGVVAHLTSILSHNGINVIEMTSCHTDIIFIVDLTQIVEGYSELQKAIEAATRDVEAGRATPPSP